jgi:hypothetical protein
MMIGRDFCSDCPHTTNGRKDGRCPHKGSSRCQNPESVSAIRPTEKPKIDAKIDNWYFGHKK